MWFAVSESDDILSYYYQLLVTQQCIHAPYDAMGMQDWQDKLPDIFRKFQTAVASKREKGNTSAEGGVDSTGAGALNVKEFVCLMRVLRLASRGGLEASGTDARALDEAEALDTYYEATGEERHMMDLDTFVRAVGIAQRKLGSSITFSLHV
jgi:hypothetical protein